MQNIPFFRAHIDKNETSLINQALANNNTRMVSVFEEDVKHFFGVKHAVSTDNGANSLHLALCAMGIKRGDKIICSVNAFPSVPESIRRFDAEAILVDINEDDFNINVAEFERTLKEHNHKKLKGAFITHVGGQSAEMDEIYALARKYNIKIIDDASRAMGTTYNGVKIGSIKDSFISCFQINPQAQDAISTAGFFTTNDDEVAKNARLLRNHGIVSEGFDKDGNINYIYDVTAIGQKCDLNSINAAYAKAQLYKTPSFIARRQEIAKIYDEELSECAHVQIPIKKRNHTYSHYIVKIDKNRDNFARQLKAAGINVSLHYIPIYLLSYYKNKYGYKVSDFPHALRCYQKILSLPIYAALGDDEVYYICNKIKEIAAARA